MPNVKKVNNVLQQLEELEAYRTVWWERFVGGDVPRPTVDLNEKIQKTSRAVEELLESLEV